MEQWTDFLKIAVALLITGGIVTFATIAWRQSAEMGMESLDGFESIAADLVDSDIVSRDGMSCYGSEVSNFIRKYEGKRLAVVVVDTSGSAKSFNYSVAWNNSAKTFDASTMAAIDSATNATRVDGCRDKSTSWYVSPTKSYKAKVITDTNGEVIGMAFMQE